MTYKKFWKCFLALFVLVFCFVIGYNYHYNTYGVIKPQTDVMHSIINSRYVKMSYILKNKDKYDGYLFGTSRVMSMDTRILGSKVYNFGAERTTPEETLYMLKLLLANGVNIKEIYLGVDDLFYKDRAAVFKSSLQWHLYNPSPIDKYLFLTKVLLRIPDREDIKGHRDGSYDKMAIEVGYNGRMIIHSDTLENIEKNTATYVKDPKFLKPSYFDDLYSQEPIAIKQVREIKELCDKNNIKFTLFFNALHATSYMRDDFELMKKAKYDLAQITDYYDFSGLNFINKNNRFWLETSHFLPYVGDAELKRVSGQKLDGVFKDFGRYITIDNVRNELRKEEEARRHFDFHKYEQSISN